MARLQSNACYSCAHFELLYNGCLLCSADDVDVQRSKFTFASLAGLLSLDKLV